MGATWVDFSASTWALNDAITLDIINCTWTLFMNIKLYTRKGKARMIAEKKWIESHDQIEYVSECIV